MRSRPGSRGVRLMRKTPKKIAQAYLKNSLPECDDLDPVNKPLIRHLRSCRTEPDSQAHVLLSDGQGPILRLEFSPVLKQEYGSDAMGPVSDFTRLLLIYQGIYSSMQDAHAGFASVITRSHPLQVSLRCTDAAHMNIVHAGFQELIKLLQQEAEVAGGANAQRFYPAERKQMLR